MISKALSAAGSDELHQRAGPAVGGEGETRFRIVAGHQDSGGQGPASCRVSVPPGPRRILDEIQRRCGRGRKVRRVDRVAGPETGDRAGEGLRLLERELDRAGLLVRVALVDGLSGRDTQSNTRLAVVLPS